MKCQEIGDFRAIAQFVSTYTDEVASGALDDIKTQFVKFAGEYSSGWDNEDPDWLRQVAADLEFVGKKLNVDVSEFATSLYESADNVEKERTDREPEADDRDDGDFRSSYADDVDAMFSSLRDELSG